MKLYFVQHGVALSKDVDAKRPLSDTGNNETLKVAEYLKNHKVSIGKIFHSGKLRAEQTAKIFSAHLAIDSILELQGMDPNDDPSALINKLNVDSVMYVGHLPNLQRVVSCLVSIYEDSNVVRFQNSAVVCVEITDGEGSILWFITPGMC